MGKQHKNKNMSQPDSNSAEVTVLTSVPSPTSPERGMMQKKYLLDEHRQVRKIDFQNATFFRRSAQTLTGIETLGKLVRTISADPRKILIRGLPVAAAKKLCRRQRENFPEHPEGSRFVMLDFDDIEMPEGVDPLSQSAIEHVIGRLPQEFQNVTYYYQFSASAGILHADGRPLKTGLNVHVFFWLSHRVPGVRLAAYLKQHCLATEFFEIRENKGGGVRVRYGIDPSVIVNSVQPHYTASPDIGPGVQCLMKPEDRQALVRKAKAEVAVPELASDLLMNVHWQQQRLTDQYKRQHGFKPVHLQTRTPEGIATTRTYVRVESSGQKNRAFTDGKLSANGKFLTLFFEGESSPGSWFVAKGARAQIANHFGGDQMPLRELSEGAYAYVRDHLKWITEIPSQDLPLTPEGFLPSIASFAKAKVSLILAPTGSGKTKAVIDWIKANSATVHVYCAVTIALVNQMLADLRQAGVDAHFYKDVLQGPTPDRGVIVTTNKSLRKILDRLYEWAIPHRLVLDEIHAGFEEFMRKPSVAEKFEGALAKADRTLMLTGTLTELQRNKIPEVVGHALSGLTAQHFCRYEFAPFKSNPLIVRPTSHFNSDFMALVDDLATKHRQGQPLPRVVIILPTSSLDAYREALRERGLLEQSRVVSRIENFENEIEVARVSTLPILIASPLFAVGLNFERQPDIFWTSFIHIQVDKNQVVQTLNRANRGAVVADVRLYANPMPAARFKLPAADKLTPEVAERFKGESTLEGLLDSHFQVDLTTYRLMRQAEKNSSVAVSELVFDDAIQNFRVIQESEPPKIDPAKAKTLKAYKKAARSNYRAETQAAAAQFTQHEIGELFCKLDRLQQEQVENWRSGQKRLAKDMNNDAFGVVMSLCSLTVQEAKKVKIVALKRLFAELSPWVSSQFDRDRYIEWALAEAEKVEAMVCLVEFLYRIRDRNVDPGLMAASLTKGGALRGAFLALAGSDTEFVKIGRRLDDLGKRREEVRSAGSSAQRQAVKVLGLEVLASLLEPLGVFFERNVVDGKKVPDYTKLRVPTRWPLLDMRSTLLRRSQSLRSLDVNQKEPLMPEDQFSAEPQTSIEMCRQCVHLHQNSCAVGRSVDWLDDQRAMGRNLQCGRFRQFREAAL